MTDRTALASVWPPTAAAAGQAGHERMSPVQAIRRKCLDCCGQQLAEVRLCEAVTCPLWPFRAGRHPYTRKGLQQADSEASASYSPLVPLASPSSGIGLQEASFGEDDGFCPPASPLPSASAGAL